MLSGCKNIPVLQQPYEKNIIRTPRSVVKDVVAGAVLRQSQ